MNFLEKFNITKIEKLVVKKLNEEEIVSFVKVEEYKDRLKFTFSKEGETKPYVLLLEKDEEKVKELFKALKMPVLKEIHKQEIKVYSEAVKALEEFYNPKVEAENKKKKPDTKKVEELQKVLNEEKAKIETPVAPDERFENMFNSLEEKDLEDLKIRVVCLDKLKNGEEIRVIQRFTELKAVAEEIKNE